MKRKKIGNPYNNKKNNHTENRIEQVQHEKDSENHNFFVKCGMKTGMDGVLHASHVVTPSKLKAKFASEQLQTTNGDDIVFHEEKGDKEKLVIYDVSLMCYICDKEYINLIVSLGASALETEMTFIDKMTLYVE